MKRIFTFLLLFVAVFTFAQVKQEEKKEQIVKFSGHIRYEAYYDTYESVFSREGDIYLYPTRQVLNAQNEDIKDYSQLNMLSAQSRLRAKINGPTALGAKLNGMVEVDFLGKTGGWEQTPRIRHMFMNLNWNRAQLLMGQTWHPTFVTECFPGVLSMGAALPFNPLNRAPQIKFTYKLTNEIEASGAALSHLDHASSGPANAQKQAVTPDFHGSIKYKRDDFAAGIVAGYKVLKPRTVLADNSTTDKKIGSYDVLGFVKIKKGDLTAKFLSMYGQNLSSYVMIGGYGAAQDPLTTPNYDYSNINTMAIWGEIIYTVDLFEIGLFAGYSANLGSSEDNYYALTGYARGGNIDHILRISPRVAYNIGKFQMGLEYMMTQATYMDIDAVNGKYEAVNTDDAVTNNRIHFSAKYTF